MRHETRELLAADLITIASEVFGIAEVEVRHCKNVHHATRARHAAMLVMRDELDLSFPSIGSIFRTNHSTVMHGIRAARDRCEVDSTYRGRVESIRASLRDLQVEQPERPSSLQDSFVRHCRDLGVRCD